MYIQLYTQMGSLMFDLNCNFLCTFTAKRCDIFYIKYLEYYYLFVGEGCYSNHVYLYKPEAGIDAMLLAVQEAFAAKDGETISQHYTEDCQLLMEGRDIIKGREGSSHSIV